MRESAGEEFATSTKCRLVLVLLLACASVAPALPAISTHYLLQTKVQSVVHEGEQACRPNDGVRGGVGKNRVLRHPFPACLVRCGLRVRVCTCLVRTCNLLADRCRFFGLVGGLLRRHAASNLPENF